MTAAEQNQTAKQLVRRWYEEMWNEWNESVIAEIVHPGLTFRGSLGPEHRGRHGIASYMRFVRATFPDFHNRIDLLIAEWPRVFAQLTYTATHQGPLFEFAPTGRRVEYAGAAVFTVQDRWIADAWVLGDVHALRLQLAR
jgi:predicted ester cyclase